MNEMKKQIEFKLQYTPYNQFANHMKIGNLEQRTKMRQFIDKMRK